MSSTASAEVEPATESEYVLRPRPPLRAVAVAAVIAMIGALLVVFGLAQKWHPAVPIVGGVLLACSLALWVLAGLSLRTLAMHVVFTPQGYRITGPEKDVEGSWLEVTKVVQSDDGSRLVLHRGEVSRTHLFCPGGGDDPQMVALTAELTKRLDAARGYTNII